jgi:TnpA family transposase
LPIGFLSDEQKTQYGQYLDSPSQEQLNQYFFLADSDKTFIGKHRNSHNRLGIAVQLSTVRFLGTFLADATQIPAIALLYLAKQLKITNPHFSIKKYKTSKRRWSHTNLIVKQYGVNQR